MSINNSTVASAIFYDAKKVNAEDITRTVGKDFEERIERLNENIKAMNDEPVSLTSVDLPSNKELRGLLTKDLNLNNKIDGQIEQELMGKEQQERMTVMQAIASKISSVGSKSKANRYEQLLEKGAKAELISRQTAINKEARSLLMQQRFWDGELTKQETALNFRLSREYYNKTGENLDGVPLDVLQEGQSKNAGVLSDILSTDEKSTHEFSKFMHATQKSADSASNITEFLQERGVDLGENITGEILSQLYGDGGTSGAVNRIEKAADAIEASEHEDLSEKLNEMMEKIREMISSVMAIFGIKAAQHEASSTNSPQP